jgi:hypothetical protein
MNLQILSNLRAAVRGALINQYAKIPIYTAEITNINNGDDVVIGEFFTMFYTEGDETQDDEALDADTYRTETEFTVGYFNKSADVNQSFLDSEAQTIREAVMGLNSLAAYKNKITRAGWQYIPAGDGAIAGIYFRFGFSFSN